MRRADLYPAPEELVNDVRQNVGHFDPNPYLQLGEKDSGHGVMFGAMPQYGQVAVKPFLRDGRAEIEASNLHKVNELGFNAFEPIDVAAGSLATYLITEHRPGVQHLGQVEWSADIASPRIGRVITPTLERAATTAASWHTAGVTHGDMQTKNMMFDKEGDSIFGDAEKTQLNTPPPSRTQLAHRDLAKLGFSVGDRGLLADRSPSFRAGFLGDTFVDPYLAATKPEQYTLSPEERKKAIVDWWTLAFLEGKPPTTKLPGAINH